MKLTAKQEKFCLEYLVDLNATQAAVRAGYSKKTAKTIAGQNLSKLIISNRIAELQAETSSKTAITIENTIRFIKEVSEEAREIADLSNALKGADLLMKHLGGYVEKKEINDNLIVDTEIIFKRLSCATN